MSACRKPGCPGTVTCRGCPEEPEQATDCRCYLCGERVCIGETYWPMPYGCICGACMDGMSAADLAEVLGHERHEMTPEDAAYYAEE